MITMISNMHRNPIIVDELLSTEQFGVDDAALMLLINSFSLLLYQSVQRKGGEGEDRGKSGIRAGTKRERRGGRSIADAFLGSKLNYWVVLAALTFGNEPLNLEEELRRRSKLHFRGGNRASFAKHDFLPREDA
ncbi:hypothetical protein ALC56_07472 [Trachymyrmex septentrionalis]|uniref:Uncharacterized protein n=1 Tax=Trachymyrmex septentrionalis TaxID=34720 RepID=A0A151JVV8_9HYME|nr:hypothetical protein ALC56_07472 [Trachymyrmex septentrionalis]